MQRPNPPATHVLAGAIALVLGASLVLAGNRGGPSTPDAAPSVTPTPSVTSSPLATPSGPPVAPTPRVIVDPPATRTPRGTVRAAGRCGGVDADFDRDGYADLVIGVPGEDGREAFDAGAVNVKYGARAGLGGRAQVFTQDTAGIEETSDEGDRFGDSLATGDFDGDGFTDLAVGVPGEVLTGFGDGAVNVIYGSTRGLRAVRDQVWHQGSPGVPEDPMSAEQFGKGVAAGDFNRDGFSDLAIGAPFEDIKREGYLSAYGSAGAVTVLFGSKAGITSAGALLVTQDSPGVPDDVEAVDLFGWALRSGDFDRDGFCDLAASAPGEMIDGADHAGTVTLIPGGRDGLDLARSSLWHQNVQGVPDRAEVNDEFGRTLTVGDFDGDRYVDLAVGIHGEDTADIPDIGAVTVLHGGRRGLTTEGVRHWTQDSPGIADEAEGAEGFGLGLVANDFNGDGVTDLAIGAPYETFPPPIVGEPFSPGVVHVLFGARGRGLTSAGSQLWHQDSPDVDERAEHADKFGLSLGGGDLNGDGVADLIVGAPGEEGGAGVVHVLFGASGGVHADGSVLLAQGENGFPDEPDQEDAFGSATTAS